MSVMNGSADYLNSTFVMCLRRYRFCIGEHKSASMREKSCFGARVPKDDLGMSRKLL
jgi:hypothetical protein